MRDLSHQKMSEIACPICWQPCTETGPCTAIKLQCGHIYCKECVSALPSHTYIPVCPTCLKPISQSDIAMAMGRVEILRIPARDAIRATHWAIRSLYSSIREVDIAIRTVYVEFRSIEERRSTVKTRDDVRVLELIRNNVRQLVDNASADFDRSNNVIRNAMLRLVGATFTVSDNREEVEMERIDHDHACDWSREALDDMSAVQDDLSDVWNAFRQMDETLRDLARTYPV